MLIGLLGKHKFSRARNLAHRGGLTKKEMMKKYGRFPRKNEWWGEDQNYQAWKNKMGGCQSHHPPNIDIPVQPQPLTSHNHSPCPSVPPSPNPQKEPESKSKNVPKSSANL